MADNQFPTIGGKPSGFAGTMPPLVGRYRELPERCHQRWELILPEEAI